MIRLITGVWAQAPIVLKRPVCNKVLLSAVDGDGTPDDNEAKKPWLRVKIQHTQARATSISQRVYRQEGSLLISTFVWRDTSDAWNVAELMADTFVQALKLHRGSVNFKDVTPRERPINNGFSQADAAANFWYSTFERS